MFDVGASELLLIVIVAIVVIGPKDLPLALRTAGRWIGKIRRVSGHFRTGIETMIREAELEEMAGDAVPLSAIRTIDEVVADPHIAARQMIVDVPMGEKTVAMLGLPIKLSNAPAQAHAAAPALGEHNELVFREMLGMAAADIAALRGARRG